MSSAEINGINRFLYSLEACSFAGLIPMMYASGRKHIAEVWCGSVKVVVRGINRIRLCGDSALELFRRTLSASPEAGERGKQSYYHCGSSDVSDHLECEKGIARL